MTMDTAVLWKCTSHSQVWLGPCYQLNYECKWRIENWLFSSSQASRIYFHPFLWITAMVIVNAKGRPFECHLSDSGASAGYRIESDVVREQCYIRHNGVDFEIRPTGSDTLVHSMEVKVNVAGKPWSDVSAPGYHPLAKVNRSPVL